MKDLWREKKEQQRLEENYWGKGSEPIKQIKEEKEDDKR